MIFAGCKNDLLSRYLGPECCLSGYFEGRVPSHIMLSHCHIFSYCLTSYLTGLSLSLRTVLYLFPLLFYTTQLPLPQTLPSLSFDLWPMGTS